MPFQLTDPNIPGIDSINADLLQAQLETSDEIYRQQIMSRGGGTFDGKVVAGKDWDDTSEVEGMIIVDWVASGHDIRSPALVALVKANPGPAIDPAQPMSVWLWNAGYRSLGLVPGFAPDPAIKIADVLQLGTGMRVRGILIS